MKPKFISLPNGTIINVHTIISVSAHEARSTHSPNVVVCYNPSKHQSIHAEIKCETYQDATDLRDRIIAHLNEHVPIIPV